MTDRTRTPTLPEVIARGAAEAIKVVHTTIPAVVVSYDPATQRADVQIAVGDVSDGEAYLPPPHVNVPVLFPCFGDFVICAPLKKDQEVLLFVSERDTDRWIEEGGIIEVPDDERRFDEDDVFCYPGVITGNSALPATVATSNSLVIATRDGSTRVVVEDGEVTIWAGSVKIGDATAVALALAGLVNANFSALAATLAPIAVAWTATQPTGGPLVVPAATPFVPFAPSAVDATKAKGV